MFLLMINPLITYFTITRIIIHLNISSFIVLVSQTIALFEMC